jgi:hypothetical protein
LTFFSRQLKAVFFVTVPMILSRTNRTRLGFTLLALFSIVLLHAQQVTGVWKGKINNKRVEVKFIQKGDSITGTSYYYETSGSYRRYSIKGYFDPNDNSVVWWDDQLIRDKGLGNRNPQLSVADFNCPGGGEMYLNGKSKPKEEKDQAKGTVALTKVPGTSFNDEWDYVIDNYTMGTNDPEIIDSVSLVSTKPQPLPEPEPVITAVVREKKPLPEKRPAMVAIPAMKEEKKEIKPEPVIVQPLTVEEKFAQRKKIFSKEIIITGDSIELRFYDNAEVDGDSISLFLNDKMLFTHVRLSEKAYSIRLAATDLDASNELTMVAENLGSIPPNTSYMVAIVGDQRYDAFLASTENSSAMIRFVKKR